MCRLVQDGNPPGGEAVPGPTDETLGGVVEFEGEGVGEDDAALPLVSHDTTPGKMTIWSQW